MPYKRNNRDALHDRAMAGVAGRDRVRQKNVADAVWVGSVTFDGPAFGGKHVIDCFQSDSFDETRMMIRIDGTAKIPRTPRGLVRIVCKRLFRVFHSETQGQQ